MTAATAETLLPTGYIATWLHANSLRSRKTERESMRSIIIRQHQQFPGSL